MGKATAAAADMDEAEETAAMQDDDDAPQDAFEELRSFPDGNIIIERAPTATNPRAIYVGNIPASSYDLPGLMGYIQTTHGEGEYRLRPRRGGKFVKGAQSVSVEAPRRPAPRAQEFIPAAAPVAPTQPDLMTLLIAPMMLEMVKGLSGRAAAPAAASGFTFEHAMAFFGLLEKRRDVTDPIESMSRLFEFQRQVKEDIAPPDNMGRLLETAATSLFGSMAAAQAGGAGPLLPPRPVSPTATGAASLSPPKPAPAAAGGDVDARQLLALLLRLARKDSDAGIVLAIFDELLSEDEITQAHALLLAPEKLAMLPSMVPELAPHRAWLERVGNEARALLMAPPDEAGATVESAEQPQPE